MKQMSLKFNTYVKSVSVVNHNMDKLILHSILWSFGILAFCYLFILGNMVKNIVERQGLETQARVLTNEVRNLEVSYLALSSSVDLALSQTLGFKEANAVFAVRKSLGLNSASVDNVKIVQNDL
jgi:hypothetical protein